MEDTLIWSNIRIEGAGCCLGKVKLHSRATYLIQLHVIGGNVLLSALSKTVAPGHMWIFKFKIIKIKQNLNFSSSVTLATFQVLISHICLVLDGTDIENFSIITESSTGQCCSRFSSKATTRYL